MGLNSGFNLLHRKFTFLVPLPLPFTSNCNKLTLQYRLQYSVQSRQARRPCYPCPFWQWRFFYKWAMKKEASVNKNGGFFFLDVSVLTAPFVHKSVLSFSSGILSASHKFNWVTMEVVDGGVLSFWYTTNSLQNPIGQYHCRAKIPIIQFYLLREVKSSCKSLLSIGL